jgi:branched-subunit amino acid transport protein
MTLWITVLVSCALAYLLKVAGFLIPARLVEGERTSRITTLLPVALLAGLVAVQALAGAGGALTLDARIAAIGLAIVLLLLRANFLVVVIAAAALAAGLRALGWG